jgi:hypothetical protein
MEVSYENLYFKNAQIYLSFSGKAAIKVIIENAITYVVQTMQQGALAYGNKF